MLILCLNSRQGLKSLLNNKTVPESAKYLEISKNASVSCFSSTILTFQYLSTYKSHITLWKVYIGCFELIM